MINEKYRCPGCGVAMEFDPATQKLHCEFCNSSYTVQEMDAMQEEMKAAMEKHGIDYTKEIPGFAEDDPDASAEDVSAENATAVPVSGTTPATCETIEMTVLHCNACGGELAVTDTEASTFCPFCGQATVVADRLEGWLKPDYIIPFKVTKEEAETTIRKRLSKGFFIPRKIKQFETDCLRGIYVPFWMFDVYYGDTQYWTYEVSRNRYIPETKHCRRSGDCTVLDLTLDASTRIPDDSSQRLEPYDMSGLKKFDAAYLSGFYSNRHDVGSKQLEETAILRAGKLFDEYVERDVKSFMSSRRGAKLYSTDPLGRAMNPRYALLPVWFLTFRTGDESHTILVNGQTGKMVGAVPYVKWKAYSLFFLLLALFCAPLVLLSLIVIPALLVPSDAMENAKLGYQIGAGSAVLVAVVWRAVWKRYDAMTKSRELTESKTTNRFVRERQDR